MGKKQLPQSALTLSTADLLREALRAARASAGPGDRVTVIGPRPCLAVLERALALEDGGDRLLFGTRFLTLGLVIDECDAALGRGDSAVLGAEEVSAALQALFSDRKRLRGIKLSYFDPVQLGEGPGYADSMACTLAEVDTSAKGLAILDGAGSAHQADLAALRLAIIPRESETEGDRLRRLTRVIASARVEVLERVFGKILWLESRRESATERAFALALIGRAPGSRRLPIPRPETLADGLSRAGELGDRLEIWASPEAEIAATLRWCVEMLEGFPEGETPDLAILGSRATLNLLYPALARELGEGALWCPGGRAVTSNEDGKRVLAALDALETELSADSLLPVLGWLRAEGDAKGFASRERWIGWIRESGTLGGTVDHPEGRVEWRDRLLARLEEAKAYRPALTALVSLAEAIGNPARADSRESLLCRWLEAHLRLPSAEAPLPRLLEATLASQSRVLAPLSRRDWIRAVRRVLLGLSRAAGSVAGSRLILATPEEALGIPVRAVRWVGAKEDSFPAPFREDPILPDAEREGIDPELPTVRSRSVLSRSTLLASLAAGPARFSVSCSTSGFDGREEAPSGLYLEILAAQGRKLDLAECEDRARARFEKSRETRALLPREAIRVCARTRKLPRRFTESQAFDYSRARALSRAVGLGPSDGIFPEGVIRKELSGLTAERPVRASAIGGQMACPMRALLKDAIGWGDPSELPELGVVERMLYGTVVHATIESITKTREPAVIRALGVADLGNLVDRAIAVALESVPETRFWSEGDDDETTRAQIRASVLRILEWDRSRPELRQIVPEGEIRATLASGPELYVKGQIDRIEEIEGDRQGIVDIKTGKGGWRSKAKETLSLASDAQLATYALLTESAGKCEAGKLKSLTYRYADDRRNPERRFEGARLRQLIAAAREWIADWAQVIRGREFPRTIDARACEYCEFKPFCGERAGSTLDESARAKLEEPLRRILTASCGVGMVEDGEAKD